MRRRKEARLLPHIMEPVHGLDPNIGQFYPWNIKLFDIQKAWRFSKGAGVVVAVLDTGCDLLHEDLADSFVPGYNFVDNSTTPIDKNGHGTHVAGTIAASDNNRGIVGIAPEAKIMPLKCLGDNGAGSSRWIASAIRYAADNGADIISMSLGMGSVSNAIESAMKHAKSKGCLIFSAAGNSGNNVDVQFPANSSYTISIGAVDKKLHVCNFSCSGETLDFLAPGQDIISCTPNNTYSKTSGTSMATPFASGCAALFLSLKKKKFSKEEIISEFAENALPLDDPRYKGRENYEANGIIRPKY